MIEKLKYYRYTQQTNVKIDHRDPANQSVVIPDKKKEFKIKVRPKLIYKFELFYFGFYVFVKFYPSKLQGSDERYSKANIGLKIEEVRTLLNTCCKIVHHDMSHEENEDCLYSFIGQWYEKDNQLRRLSAVRYSIYLKQTANVFFQDQYQHNWFEILNLYCLSQMDYDNHKLKVSGLLHFLASNPTLTMSFLTEAGKDRFINEFPSA